MRFLAIGYSSGQGVISQNRTLTTCPVFGVHYNHGVVDVYEEEHDSGLARVRATVGRAAMIDVSGNALASSAHTVDKQGVCHQLANDSVLTWVRTGGE